MSWIKIILIYSGIIYFSAFGAEIAFSYYKKTPSYLNHEAELSPQEYAKQQYQGYFGGRIKDLLKSNPEIKSSLRPAHFFHGGTYEINLADQVGFLPLGGLPNTKTVLCDEGYGMVTYHSDRYGFRNDDRLWDKPVDWLFIGDSFTHGFCVHNGQLMSDNIIKKGATAINVGMGGNDSWHYAASARAFIPVLKPSKVAMVFYTNDFSFDKFENYEEFYLQKEFKNPYLNRSTFNQASKEFFDYYLNKKQTTYYLNNNQRKIKRKKIKPKKENSIYDLATLPTFRALYYGKEIGVEGVRTAIDTAFSLCSENECELYLVYIPNSDYWSPLDKKQTARMRSWLSNKASQLSANNPKRKAVLIDMSDEFEERGRRAYSLIGGHMSPDGHGAIAKKLIEAAQNKLP
jgi:hypothetical protein